MDLRGETHINWYPGHMARAKRRLSDQLGRVDVVVELCDARLPISSRNPDLDELVRGKKRLVVLNKSDLADDKETSAWLNILRKQGNDCMAFSSQKGRAKEIFGRIQACAQEAVDRQAARGIKKTVRVMVVGVPNVGKSTFINKLHGGSITKTGDRPGVTRANQWVQISTYLELLDTPGMLWPRLDDQRAARRLYYIGSIRDQVVDQQMLAVLLLQDIYKARPQAVIDRFKLSEPIEGGVALLENACRGRGWILRGAQEDTERGAILVLDEFRAGKLGRITLELAPRKKPTAPAPEKKRVDMPVDQSAEDEKHDEKGL